MSKWFVFVSFILNHLSHREVTSFLSAAAPLVDIEVPPSLATCGSAHTGSIQKLQIRTSILAAHCHPIRVWMHEVVVRGLPSIVIMCNPSAAMPVPMQPVVGRDQDAPLRCAGVPADAADGVGT